VIDAVCTVLLLMGAWQAIPWRGGRYVYYVFSFVGFSAYLAIGLRAAWLVLAAGGAGTIVHTVVSRPRSGIPPIALSLGAMTVASAAGMLAAHGLVVALSASYPLPVSTAGSVVSFTVVLTCLFGTTALVKEGLLRLMTPSAKAHPAEAAEQQHAGQGPVMDYSLGVVVAAPLHYVAQLLFVRGLILPWIGAVSWSFLLNAVLRRELERDAQARHTLRELARKEHLSAIGELTARIVHQTRHQLGLIGISAHRIEKRIGTLTGENARIVQEELDKLNEIQRELGEMLTRDLRGGADRSGKLPLSYAELITGVTRRLEPVAEMRGVRLETGPLGSLNGVGPVHAENVAHALFNIVENALAAARRIVRVEADLRQGMLVISVLDDGPGLSDAALGRATEPFFTTKTDGTGMGLAIARAAFEEEGAELRIENRAEGGCKIEISMHPSAGASTGAGACA
jgi:signal transduction histidine kinase